ncbi:MAG: YcjX family protein [Pseudomonadota bacterium]
MRYPQSEGALLRQSPLAKAALTVEKGAGRLQSAIFETTIRLGVTGLSRAGKTIFITSLVENLLNRDRMLNLKSAHRIEAAYLQPQPDKTVPRFPIEEHLHVLSGSKPQWPQSTRSISQLRVSLRVRSEGLLSGFRGSRTIHIDIVDYPGEWLLDLPLMDLDFGAWSKAALASAKAYRVNPQTSAFLKELETVDPAAPFDEALAQQLSELFTEHLRHARMQGYSSLAPGRFLMPGDLAGAPVMMFAPLPSGRGGRGSFAAEMEARFEAYKKRVVTPFYRDHFARLDRQIVLLDVLDALDQGPAALADMQKAIGEVLESFRVGKNSVLTRFLTRRIDRILLAATKADHIHHTQHPQLTTFVQALVRRAKEKADYKGAQTRSMAVASFRSTTEATRAHQGKELGMVEGRVHPSGALSASFPGDLPTDPGILFADARDGKDDWSELTFDLTRFLPPIGGHNTRGGLPHIRLDEAAEFLLGDIL